MKYTMTVVAVILSAATAYSQGRPTFAGKWTLVPDKTQDGGNGGCPPGTSSLGQQFTATQTSNILTIESMQGPPTRQSLFKSTYKLDGSESINPIPSGEAVSKAVWNSQSLTISTTGVFDTGGGDVPTVTIKTKQVFSLDPTGVLTLLTTLSCRDHAPETTTMVYKK